MKSENEIKESLQAIYDAVVAEEQSALELKRESQRRTALNRIGTFLRRHDLLEAFGISDGLGLAGRPGTVVFTTPGIVGWPDYLKNHPDVKVYNADQDYYSIVFVEVNGFVFAGTSMADAQDDIWMGAICEACGKPFTVQKVNGKASVAEFVLKGRDEGQKDNFNEGCPIAAGFRKD